ncbi:MAG TPA: hypothetical protein VF187_01630, partial [Gemmatimonadales bacterium]
VAADATAEDVDVMREPVFFTSMAGFAPGIGDFRPANCPFNIISSRLDCPLISHGDVTITRSYQFWNAADEVQQAYDPLTTAKANIQVSIDGSRTLPNWSATVERDRDMTATGLANTETQRTWNGTGSSHVTHSRHTENGPERSYDLACARTVTDVVVPVPNGGDAWPLSGTVTRECTVTFVGGPRDGQSVTRTITVTFNGTQVATLTVGGKTFDLDLRNRHRGPRP